MNALRRLIWRLDFWWHTYICPIAARVPDEEANGWQTCATCDGGGEVQIEESE